MLNNLFLLDDTVGSMEELCGELAPALRIVGIVYLGIMIVVPIVLIFVGMLDFTKAVSEKDEKSIKEAQKKLIQRAIAAVLVFLVTFVVGLLMRVVGNNDYKKCMYCITNPFGQNCKEAVNSVNSEYDFQ